MGDARRFVVVGAGAVGGSLAVQLHRAGQPVEVVARGPHLAAIRRDGLTRVAPDGSSTVRLRARGGIGELTFTDDLVVVLSTKVHHAEPLLDALLTFGGPDLPIVCAQNGVDGERMALRRFRRVLGCVVNVPAAHLQPGEVRLYAEAPRGVLDVGPAGRPDGALAADLAALGADVAGAFRAAEFLSDFVPDVMARKWAKLLGNVGNAVQVLCGPEVDATPLHDLLREEAHAVVVAAGIPVALDAQGTRTGEVARAPIGDEPRPGGSTWQGVVRGSEGVEAAALNGEISLQGRLHGVPTPANDLVHAEVRRLVDRGEAVGSRAVEALLAALATTP
jgi:2-dehydropantoate 2-reductase